MRLVLALRAETGERHGAVKRVADQPHIGVESLRSWVKQHEVDHGERPGTTTEEARHPCMAERAAHLSSRSAVGHI